MITNEVIFFFKKRENVKHKLEKRKELAHQGVNVITWLGAIRHSKSVEWNSLRAKWHAAPPSYTCTTPCNFALSDIFLRSFGTQKYFFGQTKAF